MWYRRHCATDRKLLASFCYEKEIEKQGLLYFLAGAKSGDKRMMISVGVAVVVVGAIVAIAVVVVVGSSNNNSRDWYLKQLKCTAVLIIESVYFNLRQNYTRFD